MSTGHLIHRKNVRGALKRLDPKRLRELGEEPLAELGAAEARRQAAGYPATVEGRGRALRDLLTDALDALKPEGAAEIDFPDPAWRLYLILTEQYVKGGDPWRLAERMYIGRDTFNHSQADALDAIVRWLQGANEAVEAEAPRPPVYNAPSPQGVKLIGRDGVMRELRARLTAGGAAAVHGLAGAGKSTLAAAVANDAELLAHFADGVLWAALGQGGDALAWLGEWAALLGVPRGELAHMLTLEARSGAVHGAIGTRRMLLVIDDAWSSEAALALRVGGPNCAHLLTARAASVALDFAGPNAIALHELDDASGLALLAHHAPDAVAYEPEAAQALAHAVGGLPLALMLMGRHLHKAGRGGQRRRLRDALEDLQQAEARLALTHRDAPHERKRELPPEASLSAVIGLSEAMLDESARRAWHALSVFPPKPNTFSEEAALAVAAEPPETLDALVDAGVLEVKNGRYGMHRVICDFGIVGSFDHSAHSRFLRYYTDLLSRYQSDFTLLQSEIGNVSAAVDSLMQLGDVNGYAEAANALYPFLEDHGLLEHAVGYLDLIDADFGRLSSRLQAATLISRGRVQRRLGDPRRAETLLIQSLAITDRLEFHDLGAISLEHLAAIMNDRGERSRALSLCLQGELLAEHAAIEPQRIRLAGLKASIIALGANYTEARGIIEHELGNAQGAALVSTRARLLAGQGIMMFWLGEVPRAMQCFADALTLARTTNIHETIVGSLALLGWTWMNLGDYGKAIAYVHEACQLCQSHEYTEGKSLATLVHAASSFHLGEIQESMRLASENMQRAQRVQSSVMSASFRLVLARCQEQLGEFGQADAIAREALTIADGVNRQDTACIALAVLSEVACRRGQTEGALEHGHLSLKRATNVNSPWLMCEAHIALGEAFLACANAESAANAFRESHQYASQVGGREFVAASLFGQARASALLDDLDAAINLARESHSLYRAIGHFRALHVVTWLRTLE